MIEIIHLNILCRWDNCKYFFFAFGNKNEENDNDDDDENKRKCDKIIIQRGDSLILLNDLMDIDKSEYNTLF